jgi:hypothetical protein
MTVGDGSDREIDGRDCGRKVGDESDRGIDDSGIRGVISHSSQTTMDLISKHTKRKTTGRRARDDEPHKHTRAVLVPFGATMDAAIDAAIHMAAAELKGQQVDLNEAAVAGVTAEWGEHFDFVGYTRDLRGRIVSVMRGLRVELPAEEEEGEMAAGPEQEVIEVDA